VITPNDHVGLRTFGNLHLGVVPLDDVLPFLTVDRSRREYIVAGKSYPVKMDSTRYKVFRANRFCVGCGLEGTALMLDLAHGASAPHFNLYGVEDGELILMTKDHIIPVSKGGTNAPDNLQTMCYTCNHDKADK
jgi:5-methylcytosine-specific restriction endonuclease McrA